MPMNAAQLAQGANYQIETYAKGDPIDQINKDRPFLEWLVKNSKPSIFSNGIFNEKVRISNDSNYQNFTGDQQVTYNRKDTVRKAPYQHYEAHDGFSLNETELANNGIVMTDDTESVPTEAEMTQVVSLIKEGWETLKLGFQENLDLELHRDGTQSALATPGLDALISTTPAVGVVGGLDPATYTFWRNNANMAISTATPGTLTDQMEISYRACMTFGGMRPDFYVCGSAFYDAYRKDARLTINRQLQIKGDKGTDMDNGTEGLYFKGGLVVWDPTFDALDGILGAITYPWAKRLYMLNSKTLKLRPYKGRWMINRKPARMYDRYTHYFGLTSDQGFTCNKRNANAVLSIA